MAHRSILLRFSMFSSITRNCTSVKNPVYYTIKSKLEGSLNPTYIHIINESYMHNVPKGSETHFKVVIVSEKFEDLSLVKRHRLVMKVIQEELNSDIHAVSIQAKTPDQWMKSTEVPESPVCLGGSQFSD